MFSRSVVPRLATLLFIVTLLKVESGYAPDKAPKLPDGVSTRSCLFSWCSWRSRRWHFRHLTFLHSFCLQFCPKSTGTVTATTGGELLSVIIVSSTYFPAPQKILISIFHRDVFVIECMCNWQHKDGCELVLFFWCFLTC